MTNFIGGALVSTATKQREDDGFESVNRHGTFYVGGLACSPQVCLGFLHALWLETLRFRSLCECK